MDFYNYQLEGARFLASRDRALLGDEPGLGKTAQIVFACDLVAAENILIVPPASGREVWKREVAKWSVFGHDVHVLFKLTDRPKPGMVNVINYDLLSRCFAFDSYKHLPLLKALLAITWDVLAIDEAHYLKERTSLRTRAILDSRKGLQSVCKRIWFMTGTPMPNHAGELWVMLVACRATTLNYKAFIQRFCLFKHKTDRNKPTGTNPLMLPELKEMLKSIMIRRTKKFVLPELPKLDVQELPLPVVPINLAEFFEDALIDKMRVAEKIKEQEQFIQDIWQKYIAAGDSMSNMDMISVLAALGGSTSLYRRWLGAVKAYSVIPILIDELENNAYQKIVIYAHHRQVIKLLEDKLAKYHPVTYSGKISDPRKVAAVDIFQERYSNCRVFIGNILSAGTVITLTTASEVLLLEPDWVPTNNAQAIMRCHRAGQKKNVRARVAHLNGTLDDYISYTIGRKTADIVRVVGD